MEIHSLQTSKFKPGEADKKETIPTEEYDRLSSKIHARFWYNDPN